MDAIKLNDIIELTMIQGNGSRPIARTAQGKICLISNEHREFIAVGSVWSCEVIEIHEKKIYIKPLRCTLTVAQNGHVMAEKCKAFKSNKVRKPKAKKTFKYCTAQQLKEV